MLPCPDQATLIQFARGMLPAAAHRTLSAHLCECEACRARLLDGEPAAGAPQDEPLPTVSLPPTHPVPEAHAPPAAAAARAGQVQLAPPQGYELLEEIGRGGMGIVYRARDLRLNRDVAIKLLRDFATDGSEAAARFLVEANITGGLEHPGIPPVHELGSLPDGRPFLAMKLVRGQTLASMLAAPGNAHADRGRYIAIFEQVCQAVAYAHAHGIIHRDLKPANVMVGAHGEVQVMDWGLAKSLCDRAGEPATVDCSAAERFDAQGPWDTPATQIGQLVGTPAFMAPEQARGEIDEVDERSDVFGLGAILCVILTGAAPYRGQRVREVRQQAAAGELWDAFERLDCCGADPDLIALAKRCLAADKSQRPAEAGIVAQRVASIRAAAEERARQAELDRAAILVREAEQRKRRRVWLGLAATLLVGLVVSTSLAVWADLARRQAERAQAAEAKARANAQRAEADTEAFSDFLTQRVLAAARPQEVEGGLGVQVTVVEALAAAEGRLTSDFAGRPLAEATARHALGVTWTHLGGEYNRKAEAHLRRAWTVRRKLLGRDHRDTLDSQGRLAVVLTQMGRYEESLALHRDTLKRRQRVLGPVHPETLASQDSLGAVLTAMGRYQEALQQAEATVALYDASLGRSHPDTLRCRDGLGVLLATMGRFEDAIAIHEETLEQLSRVLGPEHPDTLTALNNLAGACLSAGYFDRAAPLLERSLSVRRRKLGGGHPLTLASMHNLAAAHNAAGRLHEAMALYEDVVERARSTLGAAHPDTLTSMYNLAGVYLNSTVPQRALPLYEEVLRERRATLGEHHPMTLSCLESLARACFSLGRLPEAQDFYGQLVALRKADSGPSHPLTLQALHNLGSVLQAQGKLKEALPLFVEAAEGMEQMRFDHEFAGPIIDDAAQCFELAEMYAGAAVWRRKWLTAMRERHGAESIEYARALAPLAADLLAQKKYAEAEWLLRECLSLCERHEPDGWYAHHAQSLLGEALFGAKEYAEAQALLEQGYQGLRRHVGDMPQAIRTRYLHQALDRLIGAATTTGSAEDMARWHAEKQALAEAGLSDAPQPAKQIAPSP